ncbi:uncharacterized protein TNCV_3085401 [Trichonephila clavipes]|nr:uncharacterized protein TNCV_3085401 [Trichonephila clavipes]
MSNQQCLFDGIRRQTMRRLEVGQPQIKINREFSLTSTIMFNLWIQFLETGSVGRKLGQGCPSTMTTKEDRHLCIIVTGMLQLLNSLVSCMWPQEPKFQERLFPEDFMKTLYIKTWCLRHS